MAIAVGARPLTTGAAALLCFAARPSAAQQQAWVIGDQPKAALQQLWATSITTRREQVACMGGTIGPDTVLVRRVQPVDELSDSLTASADRSLTECAPPQWIGTVHSHVRSTDDDAPADRFSPGDRAVMSEWTTRWGGQGAFCLVYSERNLHCEVYPPRRARPMARDTT